MAKVLQTFLIGDIVADHDGERRGIVTEIGVYDTHAECFRIRVLQEAGPHHWRNSNNLKKVS